MWAIAGAGLVGAALPNAMAKDKPSPEVEARVTKVIQSTYPEVAITDISKGEEDGIPLNGVTFTSKGTKMDADVTDDGVIVGTEEEGDLKAFPKRAAKALKKATKGQTVKSIEIAKTYADASKDASGKVTTTKLAEPKIAYEADVEKDGQKGEWAVDAEGKILESPKWANKESADKGGESKKEEKD